MSDKHHRKIGEPGYGVEEYAGKEEDVSEPIQDKKNLPNKPDWKDWLHPDKWKNMENQKRAKKPSEFAEHEKELKRQRKEKLKSK